jgi:hypothetical protein
MRYFSFCLEISLVNIVDHVYISLVFLMSLNTWIVNAWCDSKIIVLCPKFYVKAFNETYFLSWSAIILFYSAVKLRSFPSSSAESPLK